MSDRYFIVDDGTFDTVVHDTETENEYRFNRDEDCGYCPDDAEKHLDECTMIWQQMCTIEAEEMAGMMRV